VGVDVLDRLAGLRASIEDHPVASVGDALGNRHLPGMGNQLSEQAIASRAQLSQVRMVSARDYQHMDRCLRIYVPKGDCAGIR
jgi:hypothetical protein